MPVKSVQQIFPSAILLPIAAFLFIAGIAISRPACDPCIGDPPAPFTNHVYLPLVMKAEPLTPEPTATFAPP